MANVPNWFDSAAYFANKATDMGIDSLALKTAFEGAGYDVSDAESMYAHFVSYGMYEGISPSPYFVVEEYLYNKAVDYYPTGTKITENHVQSMKIALDQAGLSPWEHYSKYGWAENISPSTFFDGPGYMAAKLKQTQAVDPDGAWTMAKLQNVFAEQGFTALTHYFEYGQFEELDFDITVVNPTTGQTYTLTTEDDSLFGTWGDDYFFANIGKLDNGDYVDGSYGSDILEAYMGDVLQGAIQPTIMNVEKIIFRAQHSNPLYNADLDAFNALINAITAGFLPLDGGTNLTKPVTIDAGNISGMYYLQNDESRAVLSVEDVRTYSNEMTIAWTNTDPGTGVDYYVFFNPQYLRSEGAESTGTLNLKLMDVKNASITTDNNGPLTESPFDQFKFQYIKADGSSELITLTLRGDFKGATATYQSLLEAFQNAIDDLEASRSDLDGVFTAALGDTFDADATVDGVFYSATGRNIVLTSSNGSISADNSQYPLAGWGVTTGTVPSAGRIVWDASATTTIECPLIVTDIHLDNVGKVQWTDPSECLPNNEIYGSEAGDMAVGSMANRGGIERINVVVDRGSWLSSLSSTNETLRYLQITNGDVNGDKVIGDGHLFIGNQLDDNPHFGYMVDYKAKGPDSSYQTDVDAGEEDNTLVDQSLAQWTDRAFLLATDGLQDVKVIDAAGYTGNLNIGAEITLSSFEKYLRDVDGIRNMGDGYAPRGEFVYDLGTKGDILNMSLNAGVAADNDFVLKVNAGNGADFINFRFMNQESDESYCPITDNQIRNSNALRNVDLNGDAGRDTIKVWGRTALTANGGEGNDVIFVSQRPDLQEDDFADHLDYLGFGVEQNAVFVFNAGAPDDRGILSTNVGAQSLYNDILSTVSQVTYNGAAANENIQVRVTFKGISTGWTTITSHTGNGATGSVETTLINDTIIKAISDSATLSQVLVAKDGAGYSLLIESLIDGVIGLNELSIDFRGSATNSTLNVNDTGIGADGTTYNNLYDTNYATDGNANDLLDSVTDRAPLVIDTAAPNGSYTLVPDDGDGVYGDLAVGDHVAVRVDGRDFDNNFPANLNGGVVYYAQTALADANGDGITDDDIVAALNTARDENGVLLNSIYAITDNGAAGNTEGVVITPIDLTDYVDGWGYDWDLNAHYAELYDVRDLTDYVTGTNVGTDSLNRVWGGGDNDVVVLNVNSTPEWYDVLEFHNTAKNSEGRDTVFNFQIGSDKIDFSAYGRVHAAAQFTNNLDTTGSVSGGILTEAQAAAALNAYGYAASSRGGAIIQHNNSDTYTIVKVVNDADARVATGEVTILGTVTFDSSTGVISDADLV